MTVVLFSGGLDSAVCLALNPQASAMFVDYAQPHFLQERTAAIGIATYMGAELHTAEVRRWYIDRSDPNMLVPGRNLVLISLAATLGEKVVFGANADDHADYEDCRPEFFDSLQPLVDVETPLIDKTKPEIMVMALDLDVPVDRTWSCYYPQSGGKPCGECNACRTRALA